MITNYFMQKQKTKIKIKKMKNLKSPKLDQTTNNKILTSFSYRLNHQDIVVMMRCSEVNLKRKLPTRGSIVVPIKKTVTLTLNLNHIKVQISIFLICKP